MTTLRQLSFAGGEISPSIYSRVDTVKYATGVRTARNCFVAKHGGLYNRSGTQQVCEVSDSSKLTRLFKFVFSDTQVYVLEFGDLYIRVIKDGSQILNTAQDISAITNANPCVLTYVGADNYPAGSEIYVSGIVGAIGDYLNGRNFKVASVNTGTNAITLDYMDGTNVDSTSFGSYTSGGTIAKVYEATISTASTSAYAETDLADLQIVQSGDVITIVHPSYPVRNLSRTADDAWTLTDVEFGDATNRPTGLAATGGGAVANEFNYIVTAVSEDGVESYPALTPSYTITSIAKATPTSNYTVTFTRGSANETVINGNVVFFEDVVGMTELNGRYYRIGNTTTPGGLVETFDLLGTEDETYTAFVSGGFKCTAVCPLNSAANHVLTWTAPTGFNARSYNIYVAIATGSTGQTVGWGFIGSTTATAFTYNGSPTPDYTDAPPDFLGVANTTGEYPSVVSYFQQRLVLGSTTNSPEQIRMSRTADFYNFSSRSPIQDDDAVAFSMAGRQIAEVRHVVDVGAAIVFTDSGEWVLQGDQSGIVTPAAINPKQHSYNGSSTVPPIVVDSNALYVQARGSSVRDLSFDYQIDGYRGNDLSIFAKHIFENKTIVSWDYQQIPDSIVWVVFDDGTVAALTYVREHQIWAWHRHDFGGDDVFVEDVVCVPNGTEDTAYFTVQRTINGKTVKYIEYLNSRTIDDIKDAIFMDSAISYDGRNNQIIVPSTTMTMTEYSGGGWLYTSTITLTASASYFTSSDVGHEIHINGLDDDGEPIIIRFTIDTYVSATVVRGRPDRTVPDAMKGDAPTSFSTSDWAEAIFTLKGLWHLEGQSVSVFGDGFVVASPNNDQYTAVTVTNGQITLDTAYSVIHVGLPYISDIETLDIDLDSAESIADKDKFVSKVAIHTEKSRGMFIGGKPPTDDDTDPLEFLTELKVRDEEGYDDPVSLASRVLSVNIQPEWNSNGRVFIRQVDPVPMGILAILPIGMFPFPSRRG